MFLSFCLPTFPSRMRSRRILFRSLCSLPFASLGQILLSVPRQSKVRFAPFFQKTCACLLCRKTKNTSFRVFFCFSPFACRRFLRVCGAVEFCFARFAPSPSLRSDKSCCLCHVKAKSALLLFFKKPAPAYFVAKQKTPLSLAILKLAKY